VRLDEEATMGMFKAGGEALGQGRAATQQGRPVTVSRSRYIAAPPERVFAALSNPTSLAGVLPRVKRVEVLERGDAHARIATHMQLTPFNTVRAEGEVRWQADREIIFATKQPMGVETHLMLHARDGGTQLEATLTLDLGGVMGPLAAFVPQDQVASVAAPDLEATLAAIARTVEKR
jgi:carbon monoxide dehydrogenase subunit G